MAREEQAASAANVTLTFDQLKELLAAGRETPEEKLALIKAQAEENARATKALVHPENARHPAISAFSYPEGDVARPRPKFECETIWVAEILGYDTSTAAEIELVNQLQPGRFIATRSDGSALPVTISIVKDEVTGKPQRRTIWFDTRGALKHNLPSKVALCRELLALQSQAVALTA